MSIFTLASRGLGSWSKITLWLGASQLASCASQAPPPAQPAEAAPAETVSASVAAEAPGSTANAAPVTPSAEAAPEPAASPATPAMPPAADATPAPTEPEAPVRPAQSPIDMITARDIAFLIDYANSDPKQAADAACEKEAKDDLEKRGVCLQKAREKFQADVLRFEKDPNGGKVSMLVYRRNGEVLSELYVGAVELTSDGTDGVRVKWGGKSRGQRPLFKGKNEMRLTVPNDYSIELSDPQLGKLVYSAKIGLVAK